MRAYDVVCVSAGASDVPCEGAATPSPQIGGGVFKEPLMPQALNAKLAMTAIAIKRDVLRAVFFGVIGVMAISIFRLCLALSLYKGLLWCVAGLVESYHAL